MRRLWNSFSRAKQIAIAVLFGHFLALLALAIHHLATPRPRYHPIAIHTISSPAVSLPPLPPALASHPVSSAPRPSSPKPVSSKPPARPSTKSSPSKKSPPQKTTASLLDSLSQNLQALSSHSASPPKADLPIPKLLTKKPAVTIEHPLDLSYAQSLIFFLQNALELPEIGEVKVSLTILPSGALQSCEIIASKNPANSAFLKNRLPQLPFPCFNDVDSKTLTLVFRNVEVH